MLDKPLLAIENLHVRVGGREILRGIDLDDDRPGARHHGTQRVGKSTLARVPVRPSRIRSHPGHDPYKGQDLLAMDPEIRPRRRVHGLSVPGRDSGDFHIGLSTGCGHHAGHFDQANKRAGASIQNGNFSRVDFRVYVIDFHTDQGGQKMFDVLTCCPFTQMAVQSSVGTLLDTAAEEASFRRPYGI